MTRSCVEGSQNGASAWLSIRSSTGVLGAWPSSQPERLSGRGLAPLSGWRATFSPSSEHLAVLSRLDAEGGEEVAHHHAVEPRLDRERLEILEVLNPAAAEAEQRVG